jgi:signal transduction histidine kinase
VPVELDAPEERYPPELEAAAYFVVAEALANVAKHAAATEARVRVVSQVAGAEASGGRGRGDAPGTLTVEVADDGRGGAQPADGSGLRGLKDRVETLGGTFALESPPGGGTRLRASFPL